MTRIKSLNGYAIYQAGARDVDKCGAEEGTFYVYFSSDIRDYGLANSEPEFEGLGTLEAAEGCCTGNYAKAREIVESRTTAASFEEITEVEAQLDAGMIDEDGEPVEIEDQSEARQARAEQDASAAGGHTEKKKGENTMSDFSSKLETINEALILENLGVGASLIGSHSIIDDVFVAWQLTEDFAAIKTPAYLVGAEQETTEALTQTLGKPCGTDSISAAIYRGGGSGSGGV